jgi:hypothetical protein
MYSNTYPGTIVKLAHYTTFGNYTGYKGKSNIVTCINGAVPWLSSKVVEFIRINVSNCIEFSVLQAAWFMLSESASLTFFSHLGKDYRIWTPNQRDIAFCVFLVRLVFLKQLVDKKNLDWMCQPVLRPPSVVLFVADGFAVHHLQPVNQWAPLSQDVVPCLRQIFEEQKFDHFTIVSLIVVF